MAADEFLQIDKKYSLRIEEHGIQPWGDQQKVLYDWTGFNSLVYDVSFTEDCGTAVVFMQSLTGHA